MENGTKVELTGIILFLYSLNPSLFVFHNADVAKYWIMRVVGKSLDVWALCTLFSLLRFNLYI